METHPPDIVALGEALDAIERDARALVSGVTEELGAWRADASSWSIAECLDHLATGNRVYLRAMQPISERALTQGRQRRGPARPGLIGGWFVRTLEPPAKRGFRMRAPKKIRPRVAPSLGDAASQFFASHEEVRAFLRRFAAIDLTGVRFPNPFIRGVRFSLATGLHVLAAHERRHLWQAWRVRRAAEGAVSAQARTLPDNFPASARTDLRATARPRQSSSLSSPTSGGGQPPTSKVSG